MKAGFGSGSGSGFSSGYGDGSGFGGGFGNGYGYGDGDGDGDGFGDGFGNGYGSGCGYGDKLDYIWACVTIGIKRYKKLLEEGKKVLFWKSDTDGYPCNGGRRGICKAEVGVFQTMDSEPALCSNGFHADINPYKWNGERIWLVALGGKLLSDSEGKWVGASREILAECVQPNK